MRRSTATAALAAVPSGALWGIPHRISDFPVAKDPVRFSTLADTFDPSPVHALALRAVDAARNAGATYADVRLTRTVEQLFTHRDDSLLIGAVEDRESLAVSVRALFNGYWGFVASPYWHKDEVTQLAKDAVAQAKTNALGLPRTGEWVPIPAVTGNWVSPGIDSFTIPIEQKLDFINAWRLAILETPTGGAVVTAPQTAGFYFRRQEKFLASTEGTAISQTVHSVAGQFPFAVASGDWRVRRVVDPISMQAEGLEAQQGGWDALLAADIPGQLPVLFERGAELLATPHKPVDLGRYHVVFDAPTTSGIVAATIGRATQLDVALGLEANATGTSYLGPEPLEMLGIFKAAAPIVTITANRSTLGGAATTKWDDEGVVPEEFPLIQDGMLVDYQTTREQAQWLAPWYAKRNRPVRSHGCANAPSALDITMQHTPNLTVNPATAPASFDTLLAGVSKGLAVFNGSIFTDFQAKNGTGRGMVREIVNGKLGAICDGAGFLFGSVEIWNNVTALGDSTSVRSSGGAGGKGQPWQRYYYTVNAVPMAVKNVSIIDIQRQA